MTVPDLAPYRTVTACRVCGCGDLTMILSLGRTPLANAFVRPERRDEPEARYPLDVLLCARCGLVLLSVVVRPELMFADYLYASSASPPMIAHFDAYAVEIVERFAPPGSLVVEFGSNDGVLLRPLAARGVRVVGIEPAANLAAEANAAGAETWTDFFGTPVVRRIVAEKGRARALLGNNVLAHVHELRDVLSAADQLLEDDGVVVVEVPYLADLLERVEYDTVYHEHLSYFSLSPLATLFASAGFELFDVRHLSIHGGSIRVFAGRAGRRPSTSSVREMLAHESAAGLRRPETYIEFAARVSASRDALRGLLGTVRAAGCRIAGLGASAKGNTLLNYCEIGPDTIEFIGDSTPAKVGLLTPGMHIPVKPEDAVTREQPDYTVLLAWNFADAIVARHAEYGARGGRFIHPIPLARILEARP